MADTLLDAHPEVDDKVIDVWQSLISWNRISVTKTLTEVFQTILQESGILEHILALPQPVIELNRFGSLFEDVKEQATSFPGISLPEYVFNLNVMEENHIRLPEQSLLEDIDAVTSPTPNGSFDPADYILPSDSKESTPYQLLLEINQPGDNQPSLVYAVEIDNSLPRGYQLLELRGFPKREADDEKGKEVWGLYYVDESFTTALDLIDSVLLTIERTK